MLQKEPRGREVNDGDRFVFNRDLTAKLYRIKVNSIQLKETAEENEKTHEAVFRDRQYQVREKETEAGAGRGGEVLRAPSRLGRYFFVDEVLAVVVLLCVKTVCAVRCTGRWVEVCPRADFGRRVMRRKPLFWRHEPVV